MITMEKVGFVMLVVAVLGLAYAGDLAIYMIMHAKF